MLLEFKKFVTSAEPNVQATARALEEAADKAYEERSRVPRSECPVP